MDCLTTVKPRHLRHTEINWRELRETVYRRTFGRRTPCSCSSRGTDNDRRWRTCGRRRGSPVGPHDSLRSSQGTLYEDSCSSTQALLGLNGVFFNVYLSERSFHVTMQKVPVNGGKNLFILRKSTRVVR